MPVERVGAEELSRRRDDRRALLGFERARRQPDRRPERVGTREATHRFDRALGVECKHAEQRRASR